MESLELFNKPFLYPAGKTWYDDTRVKRSEVRRKLACGKIFDPNIM